MTVHVVDEEKEAGREAEVERSAERNHQVETLRQDAAAVTQPLSTRVTQPLPTQPELPNLSPHSLSYLTSPHTA